MTATGPAIMEVDPGSVAGTAVDRFLDEPLARGLNGETAVDRFLDEPSDRGPAGENLWRKVSPMFMLEGFVFYVGADVVCYPMAAGEFYVDAYGSRCGRVI